jgi:deoxyribose-phosphate aldolase
MDIAAMIDHTLLKPEATAPMIQKLCQEAAQHHFKAVCVNPCWVKLAAAYLKGSGVLVATVIGFPLGASHPAGKSVECSLALQDGAEEFDVVMNIGALKSGHTDFVQKEIGSLVDAVKGKTVKVILETCLLTDEEKKLACRLAKEAGAHFVKTSTGFGAAGATLEDVALMRAAVGSQLGVKASGGIRDLNTALAMVAHGATRLGTSSGVSLVTQ